MHFVCRMGTCDFYLAGEREDGAREVVDEEMLMRLVNLRIV